MEIVKPSDSQDLVMVDCDFLRCEQIPDDIWFLILQYITPDIEKFLYVSVSTHFYRLVHNSIESLPIYLRDYALPKVPFGNEFVKRFPNISRFYLTNTSIITVTGDVLKYLDKLNYLCICRMMVLLMMILRILQS